MIFPSFEEQPTALDKTPVGPIGVGDTVRPNLWYGPDRVVTKVGACTYTFDDGSSGHHGDYDKVTRIGVTWAAPPVQDLMGAVDPDTLDAFMEANPLPDPVSAPSHYHRFLIEPQTFAMANGLNFLEGNVVKYTCRAPYKGKRLEDLKKARRSLDMLIETAEREARIENGEAAADVWKVRL